MRARSGGLRPARPASCREKIYPDEVVMARAEREPDFVGSSDGDGSVQRHLREELLDVRNRHPDAAVRGRSTERRDFVRAVNAGAVVEAEPARLDRVLGTGWDHTSRKVACPGAVRHVPRWVHL